MKPLHTLSAALLVCTFFAFRCVGPVEPVARGTGGSETEAKVIGRAVRADSTPAVGAAVYLHGAGARSAGPLDAPYALTGDSGRFVIDSLDSGSYLIEIVDVSESRISAASRAFAVTGREKDGVKVLSDIVLRAAGSITGSVERHAGGPASAVTVLLRYEGFLVGETTVDSGGFFELSSLPAGTYSVAIEPSDTTLVRLSYPWIRVEEGGRVDLGTVELIPATALSSRPAYVADSAAVRAILDSNGLDVSVSAVVSVSPETFRIHELHLAHQGLDVLPRDIAVLTGLTLLDLRHNTLTRLPDELCGLVSLRKLLVDGNVLPHLPDSLGALRSLETLSATGNVLTELPASLGALDALTHLHLDNNRLSALPDNTGDLAALELLSLDNNRLPGLPADMGRLVLLRRLSVKGNDLAALPAALGELLSLRQLLLDDNELSVLPEEVGNLASLEMLWVGGNRLKVLPASIGRCSALLIIDLSRNELTGLPDALGDLARLVTIDLAGNRLNSLPPSLAGCTAVSNLDLSGNRLCTLPPALAAWAEERDRDWSDTQQCGSDTTAPITLLAPNGGAVYTPGDTVTVAWETSPSVSIDAVYLELTVDGGMTWLNIPGYPVTVNDDQWGAYQWTVREPLTVHDGAQVSVISPVCRVRVSAYSQPELGDQSDTTFRIMERRSLTLSSPGGGETYAVGDTMRVRWQADGIVAVVCSLSVDSGSSWVGIIDPSGIYRSDAARWGDVSWVIPATVFDMAGGRVLPTASRSCLVKVSDFIGCAYGTCYEARSDSVFTITN